MNVSPYAPPSASSNVPPPLPKPTIWIAVVLSLLAPGVGHVYAGRATRGLAWVFALIPWAILLAIGERIGATAFLLVLCAVLVIPVGSAIDAGRVAGQSKARAKIPLLLLAWLLFFVVSRVEAFAIRIFVVEAFKIPSGGMIPTLAVGDHVFADKTRTPRRGDLAVFPFPERPQQDFLQRVVGMPGDRLEFRRGHPIINGVPVPSCSIGEYAYTSADDLETDHKGELFLESLDGHRYLAFYDRTPLGFDGDTGSFTVKPGEVFMIGDNRHNSHDSRMWFGGQGGGVPLASVRGVPFVVWLSVADAGIAWSRMGTLAQPRLAPSRADLDAGLARCIEQLR